MHDDLAPPVAADRIFGAHLPVAVRYVDLLAEHGVERGLIGPREVPRLWERHVLNSAVLGELIPDDARVVDVGSGAGLPGIPLAIARPDLDVVLLEPMARRVEWLAEVAATLDLAVTVLRGRAEERAVRDRLGGVDVVTARAVAPLGRLAGWGLPLLRADGLLLALKGASAADELARDGDAVARSGGSGAEIRRCGTELLDEPATVIAVRRNGRINARARQRSGQQGRR